MENHIYSALKDPVVRAFVSRVQEVVKTSDDDSLEGDIRALFEKDRFSIDKLAIAVTDMMRERDDILNEVGLEISHYVFNGNVRRKAVVRSVCPTCTLDEDDDIKIFGRKKTHLITEDAPNYIYSHDYDLGNAPENLYPPHCEDCGSKRDVVSISNLLVPVDHREVVAMLATRLKRPGRIVPKLTDILCYPELARSMSDIMGFYLAIDPVNYAIMNTKNPGCMLNRYLSPLMSQGVDEDSLHYLYLSLLQQHFSVSFDAMKDDFIKNPHVRESDDGIREFYKALHLTMHFEPLPGEYEEIEGQVKTIQAHRRENNPRSRINHQWYEEKAEIERMQRWDGRAYLIHDIMMEVWKFGANSALILPYRR